MKDGRKSSARCKDIREGGNKETRGKGGKNTGTRLNGWYRMVRGSKESKYLERMKKGSRWGRIIRFRIGEGMLVCKYGMNEKEKECRMCGYKREDWEHVLDRCVAGIDESKGMDE